MNTGMAQAVDIGADIIETPDKELAPIVDDDPLGIALALNHTLPRRIAEWAAREPDRLLLVEVTGRRCTYGELYDEIGRWGRVLLARGVRPGDRVLSMLPSSIDAHALWIAASCIGAVEVPINFELRGEFLDHALRDPGGQLCFVRPEHAAVPATSDVRGIEVIEVPRDGSLTLASGPLELTSLPRPSDPSCVIYTSGTTGPSKGVIVSWAQMSATIGRIPRSWLSERDVVYSCHPMFHVTGRSPLPSMCDVGGQVVLRERLSVSEFWTDVRRFGCTSTTVNTSLLLGTPERDDDRDNPLRVCFTAGNRAHATRFAERFDVTMVECYGSTEAGFPITLRDFPHDGSRPCGWLRRGYQARIVDEVGVDVADGESGELWVRPPAPELITSGYLNQPELTSKAIADGWYRTGDRLRHLGGGRFEFLDRMRDTIRRLGENISSVALEGAVIGDADVIECAAVGVPDPVTGQNVLLVVKPHPEVDLDPAALYDRLESRLPKYMRPTYIVVLDELPRTPTNKIRKNVLRDQVDLETAWQAPSRHRLSGPMA